MSYIRQTWVDGTSIVDAEKLNYIEDGIYDNSLDIETLQNGNVYSTTEVDTGKKWINNKPIYRKVFEKTTPNSTSWTLIENNNYDFIVNIYGEVIISEHYSINDYMKFYASSGSLYYQNRTSSSQNKSATFWVEYTKTTD